MPCLQQLVHSCLNLQIVGYGTSFNGLTIKDMIHEAYIEAGVYGTRQQTTLQHQCQQLCVVGDLQRTYHAKVQSYGTTHDIVQLSTNIYIAHKTL